MRFILFCVLWANLNLAVAAPKVTVEMRDHGYTLGDFIESKVHIVLDQDEVIDDSALPVAGPVNAWLDLKTLQAESHQNVYDLTFRWQTFATVETARKLKIPDIQIKTTGKKVGLIEIPGHEFWMSPVLPNPLEDVQPKKTIAPSLVDLNPKIMRTGVLLLIALMFFGFWLWLIDRLPFFARSPSPFSLLSRKLKKKIGPLDMDDMKAIHAALNQVAGETLYPNTLARLFEQAPYLGHLRQSIESFFESSWKCFYQSAEQKPDRLEAKSWISQAARAARLSKS